MNSATKLRDLAQSEGTPLTGWMQLRVDSPNGMDAFLAVQHPDRRPALIFEVAATDVPNGWRIPEVRGLDVHKGQGDGREFRLVIAASQTSFWDPFVILADDVLDVVAASTSAPNGLARLARRLEIWARFFDRAGSGILARPERLGLLGELYLLDKYLLPTYAEAAIDAWRGPTGDAHDFLLGDRTIEAKCTSSQQPVALEISSAGQLDDRGMGSLYLFAVRVVEGPAGGVTIPSLVERIRTRLAGAATSFDDKLLQSGYVDAHRETYAAECFAVREDAFFAVTAGFPSLRESELPVGVGNVRYSVDWSACKPFQVASAKILGET